MALNLQATMGADMGCREILRPFQYIYSKPPTPGYGRQIILITDGGVLNVDQVLQLVARHAHETRLFAVGVGHHASINLVRGAARAGRGRSEMVAEESQLQQKVMGLVASMVQESVQEVSIACEVEPPSRVTLVPKVPPIIFGGQHLTLYARVPATTQVKSVTVRGQLGSTLLLSTVEGQQVTTVHDEAKLLHRLAARAQLQQWELDEEGKGKRSCIPNLCKWIFKDVTKDMVALSTASSVLCRRTTLIGIDKESGKSIPQLPDMEALLEELTEESEALRSDSVGSTAQPTKLTKPFGSGAQTHDMCEDITLQCLQSSEESSSPPAEEPSSALLGVVSLQQFDGSWTLQDAVKLTNVPMDALSASNPAKSEAAWATALVLVLLERKYGEQKVQWVLLATKAQVFITRCGEKVEDLLAKARSALPAK